MKLGARGISYIASTGDDGAVMKGQGPFCPDGKFGVGSPSTFPHVTAVGGTQPYAEITPQPGFGFPRPGASSEQSWVQTEPLAPTKGPKLWDKAASKSTAFIGSSSGGFSNVFPQAISPVISTESSLLNLLYGISPIISPVFSPVISPVSSPPLSLRAAGIPEEGRRQVPPEAR